MIKTCENCHREWNAKRSSKRFCGTECALEVARTRKHRICIRNGCETSFLPGEPEQKFCGRSCAARVSNAESPKRKAMYPTRRCFCGERLTHSKIHCSHEHSFAYRRAYRINEWIDGRSTGSAATGLLSRTFRNHLMEMAGHKCTRCGWGTPNPVLGKPILTVDHIDGNWKNNSVDNLIVLCYNCHTLTPTFNALNIGKGAGVRGSGNRAYPDYKNR